MHHETAKKKKVGWHQYIVSSRMSFKSIWMKVYCLEDGLRIQNKSIRLKCNTQPWNAVEAKFSECWFPLSDRSKPGFNVAFISAPILREEKKSADKGLVTYQWNSGTYDLGA